MLKSNFNVINFTLSTMNIMLHPFFSNKFIKQKVEYIHNNPVRDKIVAFPEDYYYSSARNYAGLDNELAIILLDLFLSCQSLWAQNAILR